MDAKGIGRATVVGHSLGSFIATNLAADHPRRVDRLVLVGSGRWCDPVQCAEVREMALATPDEPDPEQVRAFQRSSFFAEPDRAVFAAIMTQSLKVPGRVWRQALVSAVDDDRRQQLPRIRARTLVLAGRQDGFFPEAEQRSLHALLRDARLILYDDTGHFPQFERPERFVEDIVAFIREPAVHARTGS